MKCLLLIYAGLVAIALTFHTPAANKGPECGPGVLCIRTQHEVRAVLADVPQRYTQEFTSQGSGH